MMKKLFQRAGIAAASAAVVGATVFGAGLAAAEEGGTAVAPTPAAAPDHDLQIVGGVHCKFGPGTQWSQPWVWQMERWVGVTNVGTKAMTNVSVTEVGGPTKHAAKLEPSKTLIAAKYVTRGCQPAAIAGYAIGAEIENPLNNAGFWWSDRVI